MRAVLLSLFVAYASAQVVQNVCKPYEIVFILDQSENAKKASTLDGGVEFQLLTTAWRTYMTDLQRSGDSLFRIWAWDYSSRATPQELVPRGSRPSQSMTPAIGSLSSGGSWTYMGIDQIKNASPNMANNLVIIISAQGSMNTARRAQAQATYNAIRARGWNTYVIGVKSSPTIDTAELTLVNGGRAPIILDDGAATNKKSYRLLGNELTNIKNRFFCPPVTVTLPPTRPPVVPSTGICSNCKIQGGYGFDRHPTICDAFYQCLPDGSYILKYCAQSLVWDDNIATCVRPTAFQCPSGACSAALVGRLYTSGVCCNQYFSCNGSALEYLRCPMGQTFDVNSQRCVTVANPQATCVAAGGWYCNFRVITTAVNCSNFAPDPLGNPCQYLHNGVTEMVAAGTTWDQTKCSLVTSDACTGLQTLSNRNLYDTSATCSAIVISDWQTGRPLVYSQRDPNLKLFVLISPGVVNTGGRLIFRPNTAGYSAYYYFFNNNQLPRNSAFRVVFSMAATAVIGTEYDVFSNNYCPLCPATISVTARRTTTNSLTITSKFTDSISQSIVQTSTTCQDNGGAVDLVLVWAANEIHGRIKAGGTTVQVPSVQHSPLGGIAPNKCGILLGGGPNSNFVGSIDSFAYYSACANIDDVMNM